MEKGFITPNQQVRNLYLPSASTSKDQSYTEYLQLLKSKGLYVNPKCFPSMFQLKNGLQYPGVATSQEMGPNEVLVRVPKDLVLNSWKATQRPQLKEVFAQQFYHEDWAWEDRVLNTYLLYIYGQKQTSNIWYHMVNHLSKDIDIIGFWPESDLDKFKDLTVKCAAEMDNESFEQEWQSFEKIKQKHQILQHEVFSKQNYRWIFIHLVSRCFGKQLQFTSMVPFCQFFNHHAVDGYYDVQVLNKKEETENKQQKKEQNTNNDNEAEEIQSITTDGSYLSQDYIEVGQFAYDEIQSQPFTWECKQHLDLDQKQKEIILQKKDQILKDLQQKLTWQDSTILFVPHLIQRTNLITTEYRAGRKPFQRSLDQLTLIQSSIQLYKTSLTSAYKRWKNKSSASKHKTGNKTQDQPQPTQHKPQQTQNKLIVFPQHQKNHYDNFLLMTGKRDHYDKNNQVYFCYGRNSNRTLLLRYGFVLEGNKYEHVWLSFDVVGALVGFPDTVEKLEEKALSLRRKFKIKYNRLNVELIFFFRLNSWSFFGKQSIEQLFKVTDYAKEIAILQQIKDQLTFRHEIFKGTYDLTDKNLSYHQYFVNVYHQEKEKILAQHIEFMQKLLKFLKNLEQGVGLQKAKEQFTQSERFIFRYYLEQF